MSGEHDGEVARISVTLVRALSNLSMTGLAARSGLACSQISNYESGRVVPRLRNRRRLAVGAAVPPDLLAHIESFLAELLTAWKSGRRDAPAAGPPPPAGEEDLAARAAQIIAHEAARARAELGLLG